MTLFAHRTSTLTWTLFILFTLLLLLPFPLQASQEGLSIHGDSSVILPEGFSKLEGKNLEFYYPVRGKARAEELLPIAEKGLADMIDMIGFTPKLVTRIYMAASNEDWRLLQPNRGPVPNWAAGIAYPYIGVVVLRQAGGTGGAIDIKTTMLHELSHIVFRQATEGRDIPKWFVEGIAIYHSREFSFERAKLLAYAAAQGRLYKLTDLSDSFRVRDISLAYAQSFEFVNYLVGEFGRTRMNLLVKKLSKGEDFDKALVSAFGRPIDELEKEWLSTIRMRWNWIPLLFSGTSIWIFASFLFIASYIKRRREKARKMQEWEEAENPYRGLNMEDDDRTARQLRENLVVLYPPTETSDDKGNGTPENKKPTIH